MVKRLCFFFVLSVWLLLLSFMFNPWALLFLLYCFVFCLFLLSLLSWSLKSFQYLPMLGLVFFVSLARFPRDRVFVGDGFSTSCFRFVLVLTVSLSIVSRFRGINGKKLISNVFFFCNFVQHRGFCTQSFFLEPIYGLSFFVVCFFIHFACLRRRANLRACLHQNCTC